MFEEYEPLARIPDNSKAGITVRLNKKEGEEPFEATVYFKKSGKSADELRGEDSLTLTASGRLRLDIGKNGFVEIFAEKSNRLKDAGSDEESRFLREGSDVVD